jgi:RNA polymerase sigma-70 factor (ECF subfamily)
MADDRETRFRQLLSEQQDRIYRICCGYVRMEAERQDVFQEVLIQVWRGLDGFRGLSSIDTWVYRVTVNTCLGWLRGERRRTRVLEAGTVVDALPGAADEMPDARLEREDDAQLLYACIGDLPVADRALISLHLEDLDTAAIAEVLGITEVNVRVKLHRIRKRLASECERRSHGSR